MCLKNQFCWGRKNPLDLIGLEKGHNQRLISLAFFMATIANHLQYFKWLSLLSLQSKLTNDSKNGRRRRRGEALQFGPIFRPEYNHWLQHFKNIGREMVTNSIPTFVWILLVLDRTQIWLALNNFELDSLIKLNIKPLQTIQKTLTFPPNVVH